MIAKTSWFAPRKYTGWGLNPKTWQGWAYIIVMVLPIIFISNLSLPGNLPVILILVWAAIFAVDLIDVMVHLKRDERDTIHEALAERNAMWFMVLALAVGIAYQAASSVVAKGNLVDPVIIVALLGSVAVKAVTHWYLRDK